MMMMMIANLAKEHLNSPELAFSRTEGVNKDFLASPGI
jgi:hypothetical protein